ncbi:MAG: SCO family protein [SAR324 cluster bacterium]|uniref:SCO family protein n=1 Tax=SAR324 cluster bacterium TaxID=2024889 RepID=A0A2A4T334_9DELT|nr:MAG: SCO family protein [SAR324 cluster bacterium]
MLKIWKKTSICLVLGLFLLLPELWASDNLKLRYYKKGGDFTLTNQYGKKTSLQEFRGKVILLFFGYTMCPDVCPTTLLEMKGALELLGHQADQVQILFVTLDPDRDKQETLKTYLEFFDPRMVGLTGTQEEVDLVIKQYAARYRKRDVGSAAGYLLDHTAFSYLIDQEGKLRYLFPFKTPPNYIVSGVKKLL